MLVRCLQGERIGCGAVKTVYKAFDEEEGMEVAWNEVYCTDNCLRDKDTRQRMFAGERGGNAAVHVAVWSMVDVQPMQQQVQKAIQQCAGLWANAAPRQGWQAMHALHASQAQAQADGGTCLPHVSIVLHTAEINILQKLKHRNILRLLEWWHDGAKGVLVFITELLTDGSLRT